jgi:hypothetical protein
VYAASGPDDVAAAMLGAARSQLLLSVHDRPETDPATTLDAISRRLDAEALERWQATGASWTPSAALHRATAEG